MQNFYIFYKTATKSDNWDSVQKVSAEDKEYAKALFFIKFNKDNYFKVNHVFNQIEYEAILKNKTTY